MGFFDKIKKALIGETKEAEQETDKPLVDADSPEAQRSEESQPAQTPAEQGASEPVAPAEAADSSDLEAEQETAEVSPQQEATIANKGEEAPSIPEEVAKDVPSEETPAATPILQPAPETESVQDKYTKGLTKSRKTFGQRMNELFANFRTVDEDFFEEVEETLIGADVGFDAAMKIADALRQEVKLRNVKKTADVQNVIIEKLVDLYGEAGVGEVNELNMQSGLTVILFVGVNGVGKTTSIGKLAHQFKAEGKKVLLAAADTFRAGAIDQLVVWGERAGVEVVRGNAGGDPAAVVFDAMERAKRENADVLLVDTAGRLQNKVNLMNELEKIKRIIQRVDPTAPHEVLLVLDATTGQNAMNQAKQFKETTDVSGLVLTKLDGTAKGGIVLAIRNELRLPVKLVGLGEGINDLEPFDPNEFVVGLFKGLIKE
ncbi:signal recognition particle-docking protein FtsY [Enterococcus casseliflavus]|uniref:signal recognition particle-docking protein FtsY n=1 Tax=Enterococcus casseliflavus TaxID=37734 RepID=UPI0013309E9D|nr:signal recognition particle-docking protein FtsY [Enterococcus casseliflavus]